MHLRLSLAEALLVTVICGAIVALAVPQFAHIKDRAPIAQMKYDLANLSIGERGFHSDSGYYTESLVAMHDTLSLGTKISISVTDSNFRAVATHKNLRPTDQCTVSDGGANDKNIVHCNF